jgi:hypothetical protein
VLAPSAPCKIVASPSTARKRDMTYDEEAQGACVAGGGVGQATWEEAWGKRRGRSGAFGAVHDLSRCAAEHCERVRHEVDENARRARVEGGGGGGRRATRQRRDRRKG